MSKVSRRMAAYALLERALIEPVSIELPTVPMAKAMRYTCYHIRESLRLSGDNKFDCLKLSIVNAKLTVEKRNAED